MKTRSLIFGIVLGIGLLLSGSAYSQCPICRTNVENSLHSGGRKTGTGLNTGIVMLLSIPYIAAGTIGALWYFNRRRQA